jgi:uncharacterized protein YjeT (DUF2065 family)
MNGADSEPVEGVLSGHIRKDYTMQILVKIIGLLIVLEGILFLLKPELLRRIAEFFSQGKRAYIAAGVRIVLGVVFLLAASQCRIVWVIIALGLLLLLSGIVMLTIRHERLKSIINWWRQRSAGVLRIVAVVVAALGIVVLYSA